MQKMKGYKQNEEYLKRVMNHEKETIDVPIGPKREFKFIKRTDNRVGKVRF